MELSTDHALHDRKSEHLTEGGLVWFEIMAVRVLEAVRDESFEIIANRCATNICPTCAEAEVERKRKQIALESECEQAWLRSINEERLRIVEEATSQWKIMTPTESQEDEQTKWTLLTQCIQKTVAEKAVEFGLCPFLAEEHADDVMDGHLILKFGKHKGCTLGVVMNDDWPYLLWLTGFNFGKMDENGRAERRRPGPGTNYITREVEAEAKNLVQGLCFSCQDDIYPHGQLWRTWCKRCYVQLKYG